MKTAISRQSDPIISSNTRPCELLVSEHKLEAWSQNVECMLFLHIAPEKSVFLEVLYLTRDEVDCEGKEHVLIASSFSIASHVSMLVG